MKAKLNLQAVHNLEAAEDEIAGEIERGVRPTVLENSSSQT